MRVVLGCLLCVFLSVGCAVKQEKLSNIYYVPEFQQINAEQLKFKVTLQDNAKLSEGINSVRVTHADGSNRISKEFPLIVTKRQRFEPEYAWMAFMQGGYDYFLIIKPEAIGQFRDFKNDLKSDKGIVKLELVEHVTAVNVDGEVKACHATYIQTSDSSSFSPLSAYEVLKL